MSSTERFTGRARDYAIGRPGYPAQALDALFCGLDAATLRVVDLGAGTGISSRLLAARAATVIAVEPNAAMRDAAAGADPRIVWQIGTAEATNLPDACADAVTAFQSFHWFDPDRTFAEIERIARPGARVALVYNERDTSDPFTREYGGLVGRYATDRTEARREFGRDRFAGHPRWRAVETIRVGNAQTLDRAALHARARSTSYLPIEGPQALELHAEIDARFDRFQRDECVTMALVTILTIATLPP